MEKALMHYGVMGMRWGVKKEKTINTREDRFVLKKGTVINRMSSRPDETMTGRKYATFRKLDALGYMIRSMPFQKTYNMKMKVTKDLIAPSKKERVDAFIEMLRKDKTAIRTLSEAQSRMQIFGTADSFEKRYKKMTEAQLRARAYNDLSLNIGFDDKLRESYFKVLKKHGYNMVLDDTDAQALSHSPIIVFDSKDTLKIASVDKVTISYLANFIKNKEA